MDLEADKEEAGEGTTVQEIRGGIPDEVDVEKASPQLHKKNSSRSVKDPDLVSNTCKPSIHLDLNHIRLHGILQMTLRIQRIGL